MNHYPHPIIAREGWTFVALALAAAIVLTYLGAWLPAAIAWLAFTFIVQFFRDPPRAIPRDATAVLSPADGKIVRVEQARDPYLQRDALKISVFMNVFNVHSNRSPVDGTVVAAWYHAGSFLNAALDKASIENERNALHLRTAARQDVTVVQVAGLLARRILCYTKPGDVLTRGERFGFIRFGSRVDVYLAPVARPKVSVGDTVFATETILAEFPAS